MARNGKTTKYNGKKRKHKTVKAAKKYSAKMKAKKKKRY